MDEDFLTTALILIFAKQLEMEARQFGRKVAGDFTGSAIAEIRAKQTAIKGLLGKRVL